MFLDNLNIATFYGFFTFKRGTIIELDDGGGNIGFSEDVA
jgi:hypothetical protein